MAPATASTKYMTLGEGGTALAFVALAQLSIFIAANAHTPEYAFHAYLFAAASAAAIFAIVNRYYERPAALPPATIDGRPNYNMGPVKLAAVAAISAARRAGARADGSSTRSAPMASRRAARARCSSSLPSAKGTTRAGTRVCSRSSAVL